MEVDHVRILGVGQVRPGDLAFVNRLKTSSNGGSLPNLRKQRKSEDGSGYGSPNKAGKERVIHKRE